MKGMPNIPNFSVPSPVNTLVSFGGALLILALFGKTWGVVNQYGIPILEVDSVVAMSFDSGSSISNFPVEGGSFNSYDKVFNPSMASVQLNKSSGGALARSLFLTQIETLRKSTLSFHIITPEFVYTNYQIIGSSLARSATDGHTLLKVNLDLQEVIEAKVEYSIEEVENPEDANTIDGGAKQAEAVPESVLSGWFG